MLTPPLSIAVAMIEEDSEGKYLRYMCGESKQMREIIDEMGAEIFRVMLCEWTVEESDYFRDELTPEGQARYMQEKMDCSLSSHPN